MLLDLIRPSHRSLVRLAWGFAMCVGFAGGAWAAEVSVAVASNFIAPMKLIATQFERQSGHKLVLAFGSTGGFYAQIRNGAPFHVLLAADDETPARLVKEGAAVGASRVTYAIGRLVLWSAQSGLVDPRGEILRTDRFARLAIANPKLAPYGLAAQQTLQSMGLLQAVSARLVNAENIGQAYQFVATGNAQIGFLALAQVMQDGKPSAGSSWLVPSSLHEPIRQDAVLLNAGVGSSAALALLEYLRSDPARAIMRSFGYEH
jgi:molybdate transport system substrate-binding protein